MHPRIGQTVDMKQMTAGERVAEFLRRNRGKAFCDDCLGIELGLNRHQVQAATSRLASGGSIFSQDYGECSRCAHDRDAKVIRASSFSRP